jgi:hypothetical protein
MRSRIIGFIVFIVFLFVFMKGADIAKDIIFTRFQVTSMNENDTFIENVKAALKQIAIIKEKRKTFKEVTQKEDPVNIRVFYLLISPQKEAGLFVNGREILAHEGESIGNGMILREIRSDGIVVAQGERNYFVSK